MNICVGVALALSLFGWMRDEFHQDFTSVSQIHPALTLLSEDTIHAIQHEREGLRMTLPADRTDNSPVGLGIKLRLSGDFEITLGYAILSATEPQSGLGAGVKIWGRLGSVDPQAMTIAHVIRPEKGNEFVGIFSPRGPGRGQHFREKPAEGDVRHGRIRLLRTGSDLRFLVAQGADTAFQELEHTPVHTDDVEVLRIVLSPGDAGSELSVRLTDFHISADRILGITTEARGFWVWLVAWITVLAVVTVGAFLVWKRATRTG